MYIVCIKDLISINSQVSLHYLELNSTVKFHIQFQKKTIVPISTTHAHTHARTHALYYARELGLQKILKVEETNTHEHKSNVRRFRVPKINFRVKDYYKLIDWSDITDPSILSHLHAAVIQEKVR